MGQSLDVALDVLILSLHSVTGGASGYQIQCQPDHRVVLVGFLSFVSEINLKRKQQGF